MLEILKFFEHIAIYLSLPVICIWSLVVGRSETKLAIWGVISQYYMANLLKYCFKVIDYSIFMQGYSIFIDSITFIVIMKHSRNVFLLLYVSGQLVTWVISLLLYMNLRQIFDTSMFSSEIFVLFSFMSFMLALHSDRKFPNAHWRDVARLVRFWR